MNISNLLNSLSSTSKDPLLPLPTMAGKKSILKASLFFLGALFTAANSNAQTDASNETEEVTDLSPFEVYADPEDQYEALNFTSLSGTNKSLERLPISAEIINQTLMRDLGTSDIKDLLNKHATAITPGENQPGSSSAEGTSDGDRFSLFTLGIRGMNAGAARRDGLLAFGWSAEGFSADRLEIIRGPQALLYGPNPPGGIVNIMTKKAIFDSNFGSIELKVDDYSSKRLQFDGNVSGKIGERRVATRLALLGADINYWRENIGREAYGFHSETAIELFPASQTILRFEWEKVSDTSIEPTLQRRTISGMEGVPNNKPLALLLVEEDPVLEQIIYGRINWETLHSLAGTAQATRRIQDYYALTLTSQLTSWLDVKVVGAMAPRWTRRIAPGSFLIAAPGTSGNPLDDWAVRMRPVINPIVENDNEVLQAIFSADFDTGSQTTHNLVFGGNYRVSENRADQYLHFEVGEDGNIIRNPAQANTFFGGRNAIPLEWHSLRDGYPTAYDVMQDRYVVDGRTYLLERTKNPNPAFATPDNPLGLNGGTSESSWTASDGKGVFAALFSTWLNGQFDTLAGFRYDTARARNHTLGKMVEGSDFSGNLGVVWNVTRPVSLYAGFSRNFNPDESGALLWNQEPIPLGIGKAYEGGLKLNAFDGRLSGSVAFYRAESINEVERIGLATRQATDPGGINGNYYDFFLPSISYDRKSEGMEVSLTARPTPGWRLRIGYSHISGREGSAVHLPVFYNDEFHTNAQGQVTLIDGSPLLVPVDPSIPVANDGRTYAPEVATQALTVDMLRNGDANGNYQAQLNPDHGGITNRNQLGLTVQNVGTGRVGLPISEHQLGFVPSGGETIEARRGGERTTRFPRHALTMASMYRFSDGPMRGFGVGFSASMNWDTTAYYYNDVASGGERRAFKLPNRHTLNLIFNYRRNLNNRFVWESQININNVQDKMYITVMPSVATGVPDNAIPFGNPRTIVWTNTIRF